MAGLFVWAAAADAVRPRDNRASAGNGSGSEGVSAGACGAFSVSASVDRLDAKPMTGASSASSDSGAGALGTTGSDTGSSDEAGVGFDFFCFLTARGFGASSSSVTGTSGVGGKGASSGMSPAVVGAGVSGFVSSTARGGSSGLGGRSSCSVTDAIATGSVSRSLGTGRFSRSRIVVLPSNDPK